MYESTIKTFEKSLKNKEKSNDIIFENFVKKKNSFKKKEKFHTKKVVNSMKGQNNLLKISMK